MTNKAFQTSVTLDYPIESIQTLLGPNSTTLRQLEKEFNVTIFDRGQRLILEGKQLDVIEAKNKLQKMIDTNCESNVIDKNNPAVITQRFKIFPKGKNQTSALGHLEQYAVNFLIGPAGTGKTFLTVAYALKMLLEHQVERIVITRPIVEAGEKLGFLPGDIAQKVDPYLKPIYDSLYDLLGTQTTTKLMDTHVIEITPFAYMRGRTFKRTYIIADECQNTTPQQMKMLLTRLGQGSYLTITGDPGQVDLSPRQMTGLEDAEDKLHAIDSIGFSHLSSHDSVRHPLVKLMIDAYEQA